MLGGAGITMQANASTEPASLARKPILTVENATKRFGGLTAVGHVSFEVPEGDIFAIIGPNGAGKSTLFKLITSALKLSEGNIIFRGENVTGLSPHLVAAKGMVRTFQETTIFRDMSVIEATRNAHYVTGHASLLGIFFNTQTARVDTANINASTDRILDLLELRSVAHEQSKNLPQGRLRALGMAMALAAHPKLLLLDEPFAGMNSDETELMVDIVRCIRDSGVTVMLVEHDMPSVMKLSDRIVVINFGKKIAEGTADEIKNSPAVIDAYLGEEDEELGI